MRAWLVVLASVWLGSVGCSGSDQLGEDEVTNLPAGTANGSALSGEYSLEIYTADCHGNCPVIDLGWYTLTSCDIGDLDTELVTVTQQDGSLQIDGDGLLVPRMEGGVDQDGSFTVGGLATENSGSVHLYSLAEGQVDAQGHITAVDRTRAVGEVEGTSLNCTGTYELTGQRQE